MHNYVSIDLEFSTGGKVKESVAPNLKGTKKSEILGRTAVSSVTAHLLNISSECAQLGEEQTITFHNFVAKLLFASERSRDNIHTAIIFLSTRVKELDKDNWKNWLDY